MPPSSTPSDPDDLLTTVRQTLAEHHMIAPGDRVLVGVSGGPDSMVLLHLLYHLAPSLKISLGVAHLNHCLRGDSGDQDARTVEQAAIRLELPCHLGHAQVMRVKRGLHLSLEEAARRVRYAFFRKIMLTAGYCKLALGHHQDDNAEQILLAILRGAGPRGLSGIRPVRQDRIVRPLIHVPRSAIEDYVKQNKIPWVADLSNQNVRFARNRIRHHLLPWLASEYNPRIKKQLGQLADVMRKEEEWIDGLITEPYTKALSRPAQDCLALDAGALRRMHPALVRRLLRRALLDLDGSLRRIGFAHIQAMQGLIAGGAVGKTVHLPRGIRVRREGDRLEIVKVKNYRRPGIRPMTAGPTTPPTIIAPTFPCTVKIESMGLGMTFWSCRPDALPPWREMRSNQAFFDLERLTLPLILRAKRPGDRFHPLGAAGSQKIKKYFIDHRISQKDRALSAVLTDQRQIIWLVGQRIDDRMKVTPGTRRILSAEFFLLDTR